MSEKKGTVPSPMPVLVMFALAVLAIVQVIFPNLIHPGLTLAAIGIVFLVLYFIRWMSEPLSLILGWMLVGFGLSFWASTQDLLKLYSLPLILVGLGLAFVAVYVFGNMDRMLEAQAKYWPLVPGLLLLIVAGTLSLEGILGRERLWSLVVPLIPVISAVWYLAEWRKAVEAASAPREGTR